ncbi:MAG TPA: hypothetical protein DHW54_04175 [Gemmatimonadetes bacterium]|nr:hypothetical protein [Gemmatimonadota bacterium]|tara:strand:+ start:2257 stop:2736 length:480 start_codon:yes stop_codon:yes gene_type:complete
MESGSRTKLMTAVILAVVLGTGVMLGLVSVCEIGDGRTRCVINVNSDLAAMPVEEGMVREADRDGMSERNRRTPMYEQVGLTEDQSLLIDSILEGQLQHMRSLHEEFRTTYVPRYQALIQQTREAILEVFTEEQASDYRALLQEFDESRTRGDKRSNRD